MRTTTLKLINPLGLHARAASKLVDLSKSFASTITLAKDGQQVDGKSIMALLMLGAAVGSELGLRVARKHLKWYSRRLAGGENFWQNINRVASPTEQLARLGDFLEAAVSHEMSPLTA